MAPIKLRGGKIQLFQPASSPFWYARFSLPEHGQIRQSLGTSDEDEARAKAINLYDEIRFRADNDKPLKSKLFKIVAEDFLTNLEADHKRGECGKAKLDDYRGVVNRYLIGFFGSMLVDRIKERDITTFVMWRKDYWLSGPGSLISKIEYVRQTAKGPKIVSRPVRIKPLSASRLAGELVMLRQVLKFAADLGHCDKSIVLSVASPKLKLRRRSDFSPDQLRTLLERSEQRIASVWTNPSYVRDRGMLHAFMELMLATGMRPLEAYKLQWTDVEGFNPEHKLGLVDTVHPVRIRVRGKGKHRTLVPLPAALPWLEFLWDRCLTDSGEPPAPRRPLFCHKDGTAIRTFKKSLRALLTNTDLLVGEQDIERNAYSFRHTYVTQQIIAGVDHYVLAKNCGTSPAMIDKFYGHVEPQMAAKALMPTWQPA